MAELGCLQATPTDKSQIFLSHVLSLFAPRGQQQVHHFADKPYQMAVTHTIQNLASKSEKEDRLWLEGILKLFEKYLWGDQVILLQDLKEVRALSSGH